MHATDLCYAGAAEQARLVADGTISAVELVTACLERIDEIDPRINAYRVVLAEKALEQAAASDASGPDADKPLQGVPVGIKDSVDVVGEVTTLGSAANVTQATADAPVVQALRTAGAIIIGKTTCSELMTWPFTENDAWGRTRNPWNQTYSPGGSSGGSGAAVAAGLCGVALGSDGLGSIRVPAGFTGIVGVKPQRHRVWHGPQDWYGMGVNGPLGRRVADTAAFLDATAKDIPAAGFGNAITDTPSSLRIALCLDPVVGYPATARLGDEERQAVLDTAEVLRSLGHTVVSHKLDFSPKASSNGIIRYLAGINESFHSVESPELLTRQVARMAALGRRIPKRLIAMATRDEAAIAARLNTVFDDFHAVLTPGAVERPLSIGELDGKGATTTLRLSGKRIPHYGIWNVVGQPAVSVPAGFSTLGLPLSAQLAGKAHDELTLMRLAYQLEQVVNWPQHRPM